MELLPLVCLCLLSCSGDGAPPKPSVKILDQKDDKLLLQCEVQGTLPKPIVEWQTMRGDTLPVMKTEVTEEEGSYSIILETTVTKFDFYYCVARLEGTRVASVSSIFAFKRSDHLEKLLKQNHLGGLQIVLIVVGVTSAVMALILLIYKYMKRRNEGSTPESAMPL